MPGSLGSLHTTPQPTPVRLSQGWFTVASSPAVVALSVPKAHSHVPVAVTVTVPSALSRTEPEVRGLDLGLAALAKAALDVTPVTTTAARTTTARIFHVCRRARSHHGAKSPLSPSATTEVVHPHPRR